MEKSIKIESWKSILQIPNVKPSLKKTAITTLCDLISSMDKIVRFSAMKTLDKYIDELAQTIAVDIFLELKKKFKIVILIRALNHIRLEKMFKTFIEQYFKEDFKKN